MANQNEIRGSTQVKDKSIPASKMADGAISGMLTENAFVATAGQTIFTLTATPTSAASVQVFVRGLRYKNQTGYSVNLSGPTITLASGCDAGDEVIVVYPPVTP